MFVALFTMSASLFADGLTATLQQGDVMTPFYGVDAFKNAYAAAEDGAIITLSSGLFNDVANISKQITIIGAYAFNENSPETTILSSFIVTANNVKIEGVFVNHITLGNISNCKIRRCWIKNLDAKTDNHINTIIQQCVIQIDGAIGHGYNYSITNSTIGYFSTMNTTNNIAYIANCTIYKWYHYWTTAKTPNNSFDSSVKTPYAIYKNNIICFLDQNNIDSVKKTISPSEFYYNLFSDTWSSRTRIPLGFGDGCLNVGNMETASENLLTLEEYPSNPTTNILGMDGTVIGPNGGIGFKQYPSIPRITSKAIDSNTDAEGKLKVKITVKAEQ